MALSLTVMNYLLPRTIAFTAGDRVVMDQVQDRSIIPIRLYLQQSTLKN